MMATIEPRLMHLLNDSKSDLPPIQLSRVKSSSHGLSLPPLEPDAILRSEFDASKGQLTKQPQAFYAGGDENPIPIPIRQSSRRDGGRSAAQEGTASRSGKAAHSLQLLLENPENNTSSHSLRMILDDAPEAIEDPANKKRHRAMAVKEDFVQLPQPLKKQKSTQQVVPPIINGLHEPPPDAAVFPPISSGTFDDADPIAIGLLKDLGSAQEERPALAASSEADRASALRAKRKATKPRRKWSEEETNHLLLGVSRHGVGKWTTILDDPDYKFNDRTAGDLKDRFRTCCPDELRSRGGGKLRKDPPAHMAAGSSKSRAKKGLQLENILIEPDEPVEQDAAPSASQPDSDSAAKPKKSRAHRKKLEDLAELGIRGPFKKSHRRERRPFAEQDDKEILEGLDLYGPAWTKIQRDPRFSLSSRQPTDLRDRVRNKYPEIYARIEKGHFQIKEPTVGRGTNLLEPSVNMTIENSLIITSKSSSGAAQALEPQMTRASSKDDIPKWGSVVAPGLLDSSESPAPGTTAFDIGDHPSSSLLAGNVNEMDISRLLLDDAQILNENERFDGH